MPIHWRTRRMRRVTNGFDLIFKRYMNNHWNEFWLKFCSKWVNIKRECIKLHLADLMIFFFLGADGFSLHSFSYRCHCADDSRVYRSKPNHFGWIFLWDSSLDLSPSSPFIFRNTNKIMMKNGWYNDKATENRTALMMMTAFFFLHLQAEFRRMSEEAAKIANLSCIQYIATEFAFVFISLCDLTLKCFLFVRNKMHWTILCTTIFFFLLFFYFRYILNKFKTSNCFLRSFSVFAISMYSLLIFFLRFFFISLPGYFNTLIVRFSINLLPISCLFLLFSFFAFISVWIHLRMVCKQSVWWIWIVWVWDENKHK